MKGSGSGGGGRPRRASPGISAIAARRAAGEDFSASFAEIQAAVLLACSQRVRWEEKVVAGINATMEFAAANPGKARALTLEARRPGFGPRNPEQTVIAYFAELIGRVAPEEDRRPVSTDESIVESIAAMVRGQLLAGSAELLPAVAPDAVCLALMPYLGLERTMRWAESATRVPDAGNEEFR